MNRTTFFKRTVIAALTILAAVTGLANTASAFDYLKFAAGVGSGYAVHEASHQAMANANGTSFRWKSGFGSTWVTSSNEPAKERAQLAAAGLSSQVLSTEIILGSDEIPKDSDFVIGMLSFNIANALLYVVSDGIMSPDDNFGDIEMMDKAGLDRDYVSGFLVAHSIYSLYRIYYKTNIPAYLSISKNEVKVGVTLFRW